MPPNRFFSNKSPLIIIQYNNKPLLNNKYSQKILYLVAIFNSMTFDYLIRFRTNTTLNFFIVDSTAIPQDTKSKIVQKIINLSGVLTIQNKNFTKLSTSLQLEIKKINLQQRIEIMAELDALVAHHYGLNRTQYRYILSTFRPKKPNVKLNETIEWSDAAIHSLNYKIKEKSLEFYDNLSR